jgi:uncharacterized membrane protein YhaH (DUF805 family)
MTFTQSISFCLKHYADFDGRARRSEFWWFFLFCSLVTVILTIPAVILLIIAVANSGSGTGIAIMVAGLVLIALAALFSLAMIIPNLAVGCRRLHDKGMSGWLQLIQLISPGIIALWVLWALEGDAGPNQYGSAPQTS